MSITKIKFKAISLILILAFLINMTAFIAPFITNENNDIYAYNTISIPVTNGNFETPKFSDSINNPNGWTLFNDSLTTINGVIDISQTVFDEYFETYGLDFNPGKDDFASVEENQILMINANEYESQTGYTSPTINLNRYGYFGITFYAYTQSDAINATASAYLTGGNDFIENSNTSFVNINTDGEWQKFVFYVKTSKFNPINLKLDLMIGNRDNSSEGAVFFNDVRIDSYSQKDFIEFTTQNESSPNHRFIDISEQYVPNFIQNQNFESGFLSDVIGWERLVANDTDIENENLINGIFYIDSNFDPIETGVSTEPLTPNIYGSTKALLINNKISASVGYKSSDFLIERHQLYKLSVFVKTSSNSPGAQIVINQQNPYGEEDTLFSPATSSFKNIITTTSSNHINNNWIRYTFYINGHHYYNTYANIELWLGDDSVSATGHAFFDSLSLTKMQTDDFDSIETDSRSKIVDFSNTFLKDNYNGNFNEVYFNYDDNEPHMPKHWTINSLSTNYTDSDILNGVINTNNAIFNNYGFTEIVNPSNFWSLDDNEIYNNILMLGNKTATSQFAESNTYTIEAGKYYKLDFYVQTQNLSSSNVYVSVSNAEHTLLKVHNIESDLNWTRHTIYIKATDRDETGVRIRLHIGSPEEHVTGFAFFDNVRIRSATQKDYEEAQTKINLNRDTFNNHSPVAINGLYTSLNFDSSKSKGSHIHAGVIDTSDFDLAQTYFPELTNPNSPTYEDTKVLMINNMSDDYYIMDRIRSFKLIDGKHYRISVYVKTYDISSSSSDNYGAFISLNRENTEFVNINTDGHEDNNGYMKFSYYITNNFDNFYTVSLGLGNEENLVSGFAFFGDLLVEQISSSEFNESEDSQNTIVLGAVDDPEDDEIEDDEIIDTPDENQSGFFANFDFLVLPSLILGLAIVFVLITYAIRRTKIFKKLKKFSVNRFIRRLFRKRKKKPNYDRKKSLNVAHFKKEQIIEKNNRIVEYNKSIEKLESELNNLKDNKEDLTSEELKKIKDLEGDLKKNLKLKRKEAEEILKIKKSLNRFIK